MFATGCTDTQGIWQRQLEIVASGPEGLSAVRLTAEDPLNVRLDSIGPNRWFLWPSRIDGRALLAGVSKDESGAPWWVFLLAEVHHSADMVDLSWRAPKVRSLQAVAVHQQGPGRPLTVRFGSKDKKAIASWRTSADAMWQKSHPKRDGEAHPRPPFPSGHEVLDVVTDDGSKYLIDRFSGARWPLPKLSRKPQQ